LVEADDPFERDLIRSAHADRPNERALDRMLLGLGVEFSKLPSAMASAAPAAAATGKIAGTVLTWLATGVALGVAGIAGVQAVGHALDQQRPRAVESPVRALAPSPVGAPRSAPIASSAQRDDRGSIAQTASSALLPSAPPPLQARPVLDAPGATAPRASSPSPAERNPDGASLALPAVGAFTLEPARTSPAGLAEEMHLLDGARRALASGDPRGALATLNEYERAFPSGALRPEASVLEVRARLAVGDRAGAEALGQRVIERAPQSQHADAVRAELRARSNP
jgi:TolA-binding protein